METSNKRKASFYQFGDISVDCSNLRVYKAGELRKLTPRAFEVLAYLAEHCGRIIEKQELFEQVWKETFVSDNALTRIIKEIRQVIGDDADAPRYIETVPKHGYRFIGRVESIDEARSTLESGASLAQRDQPSIASPSPRSDTVHPPEPQTRKRERRFRASTGLAVGVSVLVAAGLLLAIWKMKAKNAPTAPPLSSQLVQITTWSGLDFFPSLSSDGNLVAYSSDHQGSFEIYVKSLTPGGRELQVTSDGAQNFQPAWSPDGRLIAYHSYRRGIWVIPALGGSTRQLTEFGSSPSWSPDGSRVAFQSQGIVDFGAAPSGTQSNSTIWTVSANGGHPTPITQVGEPPGGHGSCSWSPDGARIVFSAQNSIWSASAGGGDLKELAGGLPFNWDPVYSPDGRSVYFGSGGQQLNFGLSRIQIAPGSGESLGHPQQLITTGAMPVRHLSISADGRRLAYTLISNNYRLWTIPITPSSSEAGEPRLLTQDTSFRKGVPEYSPDGRKLAFAQSMVGSQSQIWLMDPDGRNQTQLTLDLHSHNSPSWFPGGDKVAFLSSHDGRPVLESVEVKSGREETLVEMKQDISFPRLSLDGKEFAFNSLKEGITNIWTVSVDGGEPKQLTFDKEMMGWPCWSPDGSLLAFEMKRGEDTHIAIISSTGGTPTQLTFERGQSWPHSWSPDGDKITFARLIDNYWNIWWVSRSTRVEKKLTNYRKLNAYVRYPEWSPLGSQIVYEYVETTGNIWLMELK